MTTNCLEIFTLAERCHRQFLDVIQFEVDRIRIRDLNSVRALILLNIGDAEMTVSELIYRGCYLGTNVSYNLKKLTESGYVDQVRSSHDKRVIMVRNSAKGLAICAALTEMTDRNAALMVEDSLQPESLVACAKPLGALQRFWVRTTEQRTYPELQMVA